MPIYNILLNSSNISSSNNTYFTYKFIQGNFEIYEGAEICVSQISIAYSWFNINSNYYNNASFSFYFGGNTLYNIVLPDGFYLTNDINNYIEQYCITNNLYKTDNTTGLNVYYIYLFSNTTYYANQFLLYPIESSALSGFTYPSGFPFSSGGYTPKMVFSSSSNFGNVIGFSSGTYPSTNQTTAQSILSNITPNASNVNSITVRCNLVNNDCTTPTDILDTFPINANFGSLISYTPSYEKWIEIVSGSYHRLILYLQDQNLNQIIARDPNTSISLLIKQGRKKNHIVKIENPIKIKPIEFKENNEDEP